VRAVANWRRYQRECGAYGEKGCLSRARTKHHLGISLGAAPDDLNLAEAEKRSLLALQLSRQALLSRTPAVWVKAALPKGRASFHCKGQPGRCPPLARDDGLEPLPVTPPRQGGRPSFWERKEARREGHASRPRPVGAVNDCCAARTGGHPNGGAGLVNCRASTSATSMIAATPSTRKTALKIV
jgi:hypothetical protein